MVEPAKADSGGTAAAPAAEGSIATAEQLEAFCSLPADQRAAQLDAACRGVLAETAKFNRQRYEWRLLAPLLHTLVDSVLADFQQPEEEAGPPRPPPPGFEGSDSLAPHLHQLLDGFDAAPFTLQRLCEVLLEPRKQYGRLDKVAVAIEKLLLVTSTRRPDVQLPPPPPLGELGGVNDNPPSPYLDGRPPQLVDPQQHQALLQQQAQAMAAAQQHLQQQQSRLGRLANGLDDGPPPLEAPDGEAGAAAAAAAARAVAAAEAMQLDVPPVAQPGTGGAAAVAQGPAAPPAPPPITAAEAVVAAQFVDAALADEEQPSGGSGDAAAAGDAAAPTEQQQGVAGLPPGDQQAGQAGAGAPDAAASAGQQQQQQGEQPSGAAGAPSEESSQPAATAKAPLAADGPDVVMQEQQ